MGHPDGHGLRIVLKDAADDNDHKQSGQHDQEGDLLA